jgi:hypothetical protein
MNLRSAILGESAVLLSWLAQARDPTYNHKGTFRNGPAWVLLCGPASSWRGPIGDVVLFHSVGDEPKARETAAVHPRPDSIPQVFPTGQIGL